MAAANALLIALFIVVIGCDGSPLSSDGSHVLWRYPATGHFFGEPGADDRRVFIAIKDSIIALDQVTGIPQWRKVPTGVFISTAALPVADGVLYVLNGGFVVAYDAQSGAERWRSLLQPVIGVDYGGAAPEVGRTRVYAAKRTTLQGPLYALDRQTGAVLWHRLIRPQPTRAAEVGDLVCVASDDTGVSLPQGAVTCLNGPDGEVIWRFDVPDSLGGRRICPDGGIPGRPTPIAGLLLFGDQCGQLFGLRLTTGEIEWQRLFNTAFDSEVVVQGDQAYACTRSQTCMAFRVQDGSLMWTAELRGSVLGAPVVVGDALFVTALGGFLYKIDRHTGRILAEVVSEDDDGPLLLRPVFRSGRVFTGGGDWYFGLESP